MLAMDERNGGRMTGIVAGPHAYYKPTGIGDSYTVPDARSIIIFDPIVPFAAFTITMPRNPVPDQEITFTSTATIVEIILHAQPGQNFAPNTSMSAISSNGSGQRFVWRAPTATWYQVP